MTRLFLAATLATFIAGPAAATDVSALIRDKGLAGAEAALANASDPSDRFALAGVIFLGAVEKSWQTRWRFGLSQPGPGIPGMQADLPENPAPEPLEADTVNAVFTDLIAGMDRADAVLATLPAEADPAFSVTVSDIWFDVNGNGTRDGGEDFADLALATLMSPWQVEQMRQDAAANPALPNPLTARIRFDAADADWLRAYTHLLRGASETVLAFDPAPAIADVLALRKALADQNGVAAEPAVVTDEQRRGIEADIRAANPDYSDAEVAAAVESVIADMQSLDNLAWEEQQRQTFGGWVDLAAVVLQTLDHQPDAERIGRARDHFLAMVALNRSFWTKVATETDNEAEWIPNPQQTAALGFSLPQDADRLWLSVLADGEKLLKGELLVPYWRFRPGHGVNLGKWIDAPQPVNVIAWIQGSATLPYAETGTVMSDVNWRRFEQLVEGRATLFAILLN
ncbi:MAG: hypothetical protein H6895_02825 [Defluviimonas sp.]|uniref:hypothetical protein n=1 Tax=Albidovulum sp. TaxID=1872424 RepID=UPI002A348A8B|nr:hypothetical protein [Defluviimonas sp.]